jgi:hypothetical protein
MDTGQRCDRGAAETILSSGMELRTGAGAGAGAGKDSCLVRPL